MNAFSPERTTNWSSSSLIAAEGAGERSEASWRRQAAFHEAGHAVVDAVGRSPAPTISSAAVWTWGSAEIRVKMPHRTQIILSS